MKILDNGMSNVMKLINRKSVSEHAQYRLSQFTYLYSENGHHLIAHLMTGEVISLTPAEYDAVCFLKNTPQGYAFLAENGLTGLACKRYLVETDHSDLKLYEQTVFLLRTIEGKKKGLESYVIFPTTGCNARCVYCFEEGYAVQTMNEETAEKLVDFICRTKYDGTVLLQWFGGEPLTGLPVIRYVCRRLQEKGVPYRSHMVTNASLMTRELAREARELWHLERVQVSLDGAKEDYERRKAYIRPEKYGYDVVMQAIHALADEGIRVNLRVNVDRENIIRIGGFLEDIKAEFGDMENIALYLTPLFQAQRADDAVSLYQEIFRLTAYQRALGIPMTKKEGKINALRLNSCMADSMDRNIVITPDGMFNNCEHLPPEHAWGDLHHGVTDPAKFDSLKQIMPVDPQCAACPFLPRCTTFYKKGCVCWFEKCYEYRCMTMEYVMHLLLEETEQSHDEHGA